MSLIRPRAIARDLIKTGTGAVVLNTNPTFLGSVTLDQAYLNLARDIVVSGGVSPSNYGMSLSGTVTGSTTDFAWGYQVINVVESIDNSGGLFGSCLSGLVVNHTVVGAPATAGQGSRHSIWAILGHNAPTDGLASDGRDFYTGLFSTVAINSDDGGSVGTKKGNFYGLGAVVTATPNAINLSSVIGAELNIAMEAGSSSSEKVLLQLINVNSDAVKGSTIDAALLIAGDATITAQFDRGIAFGKLGSKWNVSGDIIGTYTTTNAMAAVNGFNMTGVAFSGHFLKHDNFSVAQSGETVAAGQITSSTGLAVVNAFGSVALYQAANGVAWRFITVTDNLLLQRATDGSTWGATPLTIEADNDAVFAATVKATAFHVGANQVVGARNTGWTAQTASPSKADLGATPTVGQIASWAAATQAALTAHGLTGA